MCARSSVIYLKGLLDMFKALLIFGFLFGLFQFLGHAYLLFVNPKKWLNWPFYGIPLSWFGVAVTIKDENKLRSTSRTLGCLCVIGGILFTLVLIIAWPTVPSDQSDARFLELLSTYLGQPVFMGLYLVVTLPFIVRQTWVMFSQPTHWLGRSLNWFGAEILVQNEDKLRRVSRLTGIIFLLWYIVVLISLFIVLPVFLNSVV